MKIALVAHLSEISGAGTALLEVARGLDPAQFTPLLVLPGHGALEKRARDLGIPTSVVPNPERSMAEAGLAGRVRLACARAGYVLRLARFIAAEKADLVYVNSTAGIFPGIAARLVGRPVVWHVHETLDFPGLGIWIKTRLISRIASGILYASSTAEVCFPAPRVRERLIVRNRVDVEAIANAAPLSSATRTQLGIPTDAAIFLANGLIHRKGADVLIRAFALLEPRWRERAVVVVLGEPPPSSRPYAASLLQLVDELSLAGKVLFPGMRDDVASFLKSATAVVSASRNEALPIALVEAMAAGAPVVSTTVGDCPVLLEQGALGALVPPGDAKSLSLALQRVLEHPGEVEEQARLARAKVLREYGGADFWNPLENFLERVLRR